MRPSFAKLSLCGLAASALAPMVAADYYIDNANNTVAYAASGTSWRPFSFATQNLTFVLSNGNVTVDSSKCYDQNYALAACTVENKCQITLPFTGSGISVYILHAGFQGISASLTVDGGQSVTTTLPAPAPPSYQTPNVSLFSLQSLPSADHTATINLLDWNNGSTSLYFDYALVNESYVGLPVSSTAPPLSTSSNLPIITATAPPQSSVAQSMNPSSTSPAPANFSTFAGSTHTPGPTSAVSNAKFSMDLSAMVGGACGGFAFLIAVVATVIFLRKRKSRFTALDEGRRPDPFLSTPAPVRGQTVPLPAQPQTDEKGRVRLVAPDAMLHQSHGPSVGESSGFRTSSAAGDARRTPEVEAGPSTVDPFLREDFIIDCRREDRPLSNVYRSVVRDPSGSIVTVHSAPPPGYQTLDLRH